LELGAGKNYKLFSSMVSAKPFDSLMSELELKDRMNHSCEEER
jgi:hypothetical protein